MGIRLEGIIVEKVGTPRNDGTAGSALYEVPFKLSKEPSSRWKQLFVRNWDRPPRFTTMHRPGIASVSGDEIWLNGTTIEEVEKYHLDTLLLAIDLTNQQAAEVEAAEETSRDREERNQRAHKKHVREVADRLKFD